MAVFRATIFGRIAGQQTQNVLHFHKTDAIGENWTNVDFPIFLFGTKADTANYAPFVAKVLQLKGSTSTRHGRGRTFLAGAGGSDMDNGNWNSQTMSGLADLCSQLEPMWVSPHATNGFSIVLAPRSHPNDFEFVTQIIPRAKIGSQVRRNLGVGA